MEDIEKRKERQRRYENNTRKAKSRVITIRIPREHDHPDLAYIINKLATVLILVKTNIQGYKDKTLFQFLAKHTSSQASLLHDKELAELLRLMDTTNTANVKGAGDGEDA